MQVHKKIIVSLLGCLFLTAWSLRAQADDPASGMTAELELLQGMAADVQKAQDIVSPRWEARNPFDTSQVPSVQEGLQTAAAGHFDLQGIFLGSSRPSVIINGSVLGVGDLIAGATVREIKEDSVVLVDAAGQKTILSLQQ